MGCESSKEAVETSLPKSSGSKQSHKSNGYAKGATSARNGPDVAPKKFMTINGVSKLNPEYKKWREVVGGPPATSVSSDKALPIITSMADHRKLNEASTAKGGNEIPLANSTQSAIATMQDTQFCLQAGMTPETMSKELFRILNKYEVPVGLMNKLMSFSDYASLEFIIDDSGSMNNLSDTKDPNGKVQSRWQEAQSRLKDMVEVLAYVPFTQIGIELVNRKDRVCLMRNGRDPLSFLEDAYEQIIQIFAVGPAGKTPALEKLQESFRRGQGASIARYFFGDGLPDGGAWAQEEITKLICNRPNPQGNPVTFISVTNDDAQVEWMKDAEELAPYCSEADDFDSEAEEVRRDQGAALPFSRGFHLICQLVAAMNPDDLDAMDESVPFTKTTLDNLLGVTHTVQSYQHYFKCFQDAQRMRTVVKDDNGRAKKSDKLKKGIKWNYQEFLSTPVARLIPQVQDFQAQLKRLG